VQVYAQQFKANLSTQVLKFHLNDVCWFLVCGRSGV